MERRNDWPRGAALIAEFAHGEIDDDLSHAIATVAQAVEIAGKGGKVVLTIAIAPSKASGAVEMTMAVKESAPKSAPVTELRWHAGGGQMASSDPAQGSIFDTIEHLGDGRDD